jgi:hypothetical protein
MLSPRSQRGDLSPQSQPAEIESLHDRPSGIAGSFTPATSPPASPRSIPGRSPSRHTRSRSRSPPRASKRRSITPHSQPQLETARNDGNLSELAASMGSMFNGALVTMLLTPSDAEEQVYTHFRAANEHLDPRHWTFPNNSMLFILEEATYYSDLKHRPTSLIIKLDEPHPGSKSFKLNLTLDDRRRTSESFLHSVSGQVPPVGSVESVGWNNSRKYRYYDSTNSHYREIPVTIFYQKFEKQFFLHSAAIPLELLELISQEDRKKD